MSVSLLDWKVPVSQVPNTVSEVTEPKQKCAGIESAHNNNRTENTSSYV